MFEFRKVMSNREECWKMISDDPKIEILSDTETSDSRIIEGKFMTPLETYLPGLVPEAVKNAHFQMILPKKWRDENFKPVCIHLAGTGDHVSLHIIIINNFLTTSLIFSISGVVETSSQNLCSKKVGLVLSY